MKLCFRIQAMHILHTPVHSAIACFAILCMCVLCVHMHVLHMPVHSAWFRSVAGPVLQVCNFAVYSNTQLGDYYTVCLISSYSSSYSF
jgi:hypothetical protein